MSKPMWIANASQEIGIALAILAMLGYGAVTLACMACTAAEGQVEGRGWNAWRTAGLALCLVWPVVIVVFAVAQARPTAAAPCLTIRRGGSQRCGRPSAAARDRLSPS
ncbi:MAG: hypothetical protein J0I23_31485 [Rhizobiales bacterium]|nr:hypothetical protein [Hyphomicrobiales bacterium]